METAGAEEEKAVLDGSNVCEEGRCRCTWIASKKKSEERASNLESSTEERMEEITVDGLAQSTCRLIWSKQG